MAHYIVQHIALHNTYHCAALHIALHGTIVRLKWVGTLSAKCCPRVNSSWYTALNAHMEVSILNYPFQTLPFSVIWTHLDILDEQFLNFRVGNVVSGRVYFLEGALPFMMVVEDNSKKGKVRKWQINRLTTTLPKEARCTALQLKITYYAKSPKTAKTVKWESGKSSRKTYPHINSLRPLTQKRRWCTALQLKITLNYAKKYKNCKMRKWQKDISA